ncbi:MAG TPA: PP2C family serine/threonine-protein phosphatase [Mycobacteriales bacterium]|nr:PP2C family serine/threonine-protein phosphatase [Mycobacteriales bacterium]
MSLGLRFGARSDVGLLRAGNEDAMYAGPRLLAVADGMGGHAAGEVASRVAIETVAPLDDDLPGSDLISALRDSVETANGYLRDMVAADSALEGMGTTLTALLSAGQRLGLVHVGDSRAYLLRDGALSQITHDHTLVQSLVDEGRITPEEATTHPQRSWITRALDGRGEIELDLSVREAHPGDRYLLCTDGLSGVVSEETMLEALRVPDPQAACDRLVELALRAGGPDNITCIVADIVDDAAADSPIVGGAAADEGAPSTAGDTPAARAAAIQPRPAADEPAAVEPDEEDRRPDRRGRRRFIALAVVLVLLVGGGIVATWVVLRQQFYVGITASKTVGIYRGVSGSFAGVDLSHLDESSDLPVSALPDFEQPRVHDGIQAKNRADAVRILADLRKETCDKIATDAKQAAGKKRKPPPPPTYCRTTT